MKKNLTIMATVIAMFAMLIFTGCGKTEENPWLTGWQEAVEKAEEKGQNIFIFFSNVTSDAKSQELNESFSKGNFQSKIGNNYVLLNVDFPANQEQMEYEQLVANYELANKFSVQTLPSIVIATPEGYVIGVVLGEDMNLNAKKIINKAASYNKASKKVTKIRKELAAAEEDERLELIDELISNIDSSYRYLVIDLLGEIKERDPDNEKGLYNKYLLSFAYVDAISEFSKGNAQGAIDIFLKTAETEGINKADAQEAYQTAAYLLANTGLAGPELVIEYLQKSIDVDPKSKEVESIQKTIDYLNDMIAGEKTEGDVPAEGSEEVKEAAE